MNWHWLDVIIIQLLRSVKNKTHVIICWLSYTRIVLTFFIFISLFETTAVFKLPLTTQQLTQYGGRCSEDTEGPGRISGFRRTRENYNSPKTTSSWKQFALHIVTLIGRWVDTPRKRVEIADAIFSLRWELCITAKPLILFSIHCARLIYDPKRWLQSFLEKVPFAYRHFDRSTCQEDEPKFRTPFFMISSLCKSQIWSRTVMTKFLKRLRSQQWYDIKESLAHNIDETV